MAAVEATDPSDVVDVDELDEPTLMDAFLQLQHNLDHLQTQRSEMEQYYSQLEQQSMDNEEELEELRKRNAHLGTLVRHLAQVASDAQSDVASLQRVMQDLPVAARRASTTISLSEHSGPSIEELLERADLPIATATSYDDALAALHEQVKTLREQNVELQVTHRRDERTIRSLQDQLDELEETASKKKDRDQQSPTAEPLDEQLAAAERAAARAAEAATQKQIDEGLVSAELVSQVQEEAASMATKVARLERRNRALQDQVDELESRLAAATRQSQTDEDATSSAVMSLADEMNKWDIDRRLTREESIRIITERIQLKERIDTLEDSVRQLKLENARLAYKVSSNRTFFENRERIVISILSKRMYAKDRKRLVAKLQATALPPDASSELPTGIAAAPPQ